MELELNPRSSPNIFDPFYRSPEFAQHKFMEPVWDYPWPKELPNLWVEGFLS